MIPILYTAICETCKQKFPCLLSEVALQNIVESHMMESGHIVNIVEIKE